MAAVPSSESAVDPARILGLRDDHGVLSVYVDAGPSLMAAQRPGWVVAVENGLDDVRAQVRADDDRGRRRAVLERLDELAGDLSALLDPRQAGRGRALFATVDGGEVHRVSFQVPLPTQVVLDECAYVTPLVAALERGRAAGIVAVSLSALRVLERELGQVTEVTSFDLEPETSEWRELRGPAAANPAFPQQSASQRDAFERRLDENRRRLLDAAGARLRELAAARGWDRIVVAGDPRLTHSLSEAFANGDADVSVVERVLHGLTPSAIGESVSEELEGARVRRETELVTRARDAALAGGRGALGLADVLAALEERRVDHLLFDEGRELRGARAPDGRLLVEGVVPPGTTAQELVPEPRLTTRMLERVFESSARATPLTAEAAQLLREQDGVAALLRW